VCSDASSAGGAEPTVLKAKRGLGAPAAKTRAAGMPGRARRRRCAVKKFGRFDGQARVAESGRLRRQRRRRLTRAHRQQQQRLLLLLHWRR
jgi:hypothetical protein